MRIIDLFKSVYEFKTEDEKATLKIMEAVSNRKRIREGTIPETTRKTKKDIPLAVRKKKRKAQRLARRVTRNNL